MDAGAVADPEVLEMALGHSRKQREDTALWLAVQVLMTDDMALADDALIDRLAVLQDRIEDKIRTQLGLPDRDAAYRAGQASE